MSLAEDMFKNYKIFAFPLIIPPEGITGNFIIKLEDGSALEIAGFNLMVRALTAEEVAAKNLTVPAEKKEADGD